MTGSRFKVVVMPWLDHGIHSVALPKCLRRYGMDCRVKPGKDDIEREAILLKRSLE
jgi:hypothetical protein